MVDIFGRNGETVSALGAKPDAVRQNSGAVSAGVDDVKGVIADAADMAERLARLEKIVQAIAGKWPELFGEVLDVLR